MVIRGIHRRKLGIHQFHSRLAAQARNPVGESLSHWLISLRRRHRAAPLHLTWRFYATASVAITEAARWP
jgi:hypothetical protein